MCIFILNKHCQHFKRLTVLSVSKKATSDACGMAPYCSLICVSPFTSGNVRLCVYLWHLNAPFFLHGLLFYLISIRVSEILDTASFLVMVLLESFTVFLWFGNPRSIGFLLLCNRDFFFPLLWKVFGNSLSTPDVPYPNFPAEHKGFSLLSQVVLHENKHPSKNLITIDIPNA